MAVIKYPSLCEIIKCPFLYYDINEIQDFNADCYIYDYDVNVNENGRCYLSVKKPMCDRTLYSIPLRIESKHKYEARDIPKWCPIGLNRMIRIISTFNANRKLSFIKRI